MDIFTISLIFIIAVTFVILIQMIRVNQRQKVKIKLKNEEIKIDQLDQVKLYQFTISNESDRPIVVNSIKLLSNETEIYDNQHHPSFKAPEQKDSDVVQIDSKRVRSIEHLISENFLGTTVIQQGEDKTYSYYLDEKPDEIEIVIKENKDEVIHLKPNFEE